jgi:hypothetical protein
MYLGGRYALSTVAARNRSGPRPEAAAEIVDAQRLRLQIDMDVALDRRQQQLPVGAAGSWRAYWNAVSEKFLSLRECSRSIGMSASFSIALMPMIRCWATCRL